MLLASPSIHLLFSQPRSIIYILTTGYLHQIAISTKIMPSVVRIENDKLPALSTENDTKPQEKVKRDNYVYSEYTEPTAVATAPAQTLNEPAQKNDGGTANFMQRESNNKARFPWLTKEKPTWVAASMVLDFLFATHPLRDLNNAGLLMNRVLVMQHAVALVRLASPCAVSQVAFRYQPRTGSAAAGAEVLLSPFSTQSLNGVKRKQDEIS
ncbi:hypothetical protein D9619_013095 [Psilocybe cf. subviscida]|uniref:Uncharacterized protein n=1 Tax=Psilocybe cf. subviscida TaxID=2480587 RepID=A0A8H5AZI8_9AGAR|nr:hypothetical protein D9619_013095 [Psilocybe cf. subviscida]